MLIANTAKNNTSEPARRFRRKRHSPNRRNPIARPTAANTSAGWGPESPSATGRGGASSATTKNRPSQALADRKSHNSAGTSGGIAAIAHCAGPRISATTVAYATSSVPASQRGGSNVRTALMRGLPLHGAERQREIRDATGQRHGQRQRRIQGNIRKAGSFRHDSGVDHSQALTAQPGRSAEIREAG